MSKKGMSRLIAVSGAAVLLLTFLFFTACSSAALGAENAPTEVVDLPYTGNEVISSGYAEKEYAQKDLDLGALYAESAPSVARVKVSYSYRISAWPMYRVQDGTNTGTGFFLTEDGYLLTSTSLFCAPDGEILPASQFTIEVATHDGKVYEAELIYYDLTVYSSPIPIFSTSVPDNSELALIKIEGSGFAPVTLGNSGSVQYGADCYTIATFSDEEDDLEQLLAEGIVSRPISDRASLFMETETLSYFDGSFDHLMQTTLPSNDGSEGAPVFNADGEVIGIVNAGAENTLTFLAHPSFGISFAVPSATVQSFLTEVQEMTDVVVAARYADESFTEERPQSLLAEGQSIRILSSSANKAENDLLREGEFLIADPDEEISFVHTITDGTDMPAAQRIAKERMNATVKIVTVSANSSSEGSGFVITKDGYVATNLHVINQNTAVNEAAGKPANETVSLNGACVYALFDNVRQDGKYVLFRMHIVAYDQKEDMAILKFENEFSYTDEAGQNIAGFENVCRLKTETVKQGEPVYAIGNALGYGLSVSDGIVSVAEMSGYYDDYGHNFIQTDCPINSGNSGGPLFDAQGNVVGINSMGLNENIAAYENVSWAIPVSRLCAFIEEIAAGNVADGKILQSADIVCNVV